MEWEQVLSGSWESSDGRWRIYNPWRLETHRHKFLVTETVPGVSGWVAHPGMHDSLRMAQLYVQEMCRIDP